MSLEGAATPDDVPLIENDSRRDVQVNVVATIASCPGLIAEDKTGDME